MFELIGCGIIAVVIGYNLLRKLLLLNFKRVTYMDIKSLFVLYGLTDTQYLISDEWKNAFDIKVMREFVRNNMLNYKKYEPDEYDCDDFTRDFIFEINKYFPNPAVGSVRTQNHIKVIFIDKTFKMWQLEPQNDEIVLLDIPPAEIKEIII